MTPGAPLSTLEAHLQKLQEALIGSYQAIILDWIRTAMDRQDRYLIVVTWWDYTTFHMDHQVVQHWADVLAYSNNCYRKLRQDGQGHVVPTVSYIDLSVASGYGPSAGHPLRPPE